ncbi:hypothetical protein SNE35_02495 [Paucibacter sp. R3-3]|uniref:Type II secretion system protein GspC N-terminal domain-containing protein n=1 Tax=Roseateles agri TaxID=3098619 RepID=A0ABU5DDM7_9BURK|nr:hypothetical protein [Paucibacter sp. R3-3]MDY0743354.1 hypothetical protein [Paucibacter sp. R3-3]
MPSELAIAALEQAEADPFALPLPAPPPPPAAAAPPPLAPAPTAPPLSYRYLGQFTDPQGKPKVYIANANKDVLIEVGTELDEGYRVVAITTDEIRLVYPPLQQKASIQIPLAKTVQ